MSDGHVTANFKRSEFACKCGCKKGFYVSPELAKILQYLRERLKTPLIITSGMRCRKHNTAVGGVKESYHILKTGNLLASDITYADESKRTPAGIMRLYILADKLLTTYLPESRSGGLGLYRSWIHIDVRKKEGARWIEKAWKFPE